MKDKHILVKKPMFTPNSPHKTQSHKGDFNEKKKKASAKSTTQVKKMRFGGIKSKSHQLHPFRSRQSRDFAELLEITLEGSELFMAGQFISKNWTELNALSRVWTLLLLAFYQGKVNIRGDIYIKSTNIQIIKKKKLANAELISRKTTTTRVDQLIRHQKVLREIVDENNIVKWSQFTTRMLDAISTELKPGIDPLNVKRAWKRRFFNVAKELKFTSNDKVDNWSSITNQILSAKNTAATNNSTNSARSVTSGSTSSGSTRRSGSTSVSKSTYLNQTLTNEEKEDILKIYNGLNNSKKWQLSTGTIVEDQMMKLAQKAVFEHPAHSFILDTDDENWNEYFSEEELDEIRAHKCKDLPSLPKEFDEFMDTIKQEDIKKMHKDISVNYFDPIENPVCHWAKKYILEGLELFMEDFFETENWTERVILSRVWRLILLAFNQGGLNYREEVYVDATSDQMNKKRKLSTTEAIDRKLTTTRADQLIKYGSYELGIVEGSKISEDCGNKFFQDAMKKVPKALKDMLLQIIKAAPGHKHELKTIGIITSKFDVQMQIMDCPENYVFRVQRTETFSYPCVFNMFVNNVRSCLELT